MNRYRMALVAVLAIMLSIVFVSAANARSQSNSYFYTQPGHAHALATCDSACGGIGRAIYPSNGTITHMFCWTDQGWYTGNYASNRWFVVSINGQPGLWWTHSSYVYYQTSVPHC